MRDLSQSDTNNAGVFVFDSAGGARLAGTMFALSFLCLNVALVLMQLSEQLGEKEQE